jgi:hypothetical protein
VRCARRECGRRRPSALARLAGLGVYYHGDWYCGARCLDAAAREHLGPRSAGRPPFAQGPSPLRLGVLLAHQVGLGQDVLREALCEQARTGLRLGAQLVRMGAASDHEVLRALAAQAGVAHLTNADLARLRPASRCLSPDAVRALGLVPLALDTTTDFIRVACSAPLPRLALAAMRELTGQGIEPYLVSDEQFTPLLETYCNAPGPEAGDVRAEVPEGASPYAADAAAVSASRETRGPDARSGDRVSNGSDVGGRDEDLWLHSGALAVGLES